MKKNKLKEKLMQGKTSIGAWHELGHPDVVEIQAMTGWDYIIYDMEHTLLEFQTVQNMMQVAAKFGPTPIVRLAWNDPVLFKKALDIGAHGLIVPMINTKAEAIQAVKSSRYPPAGIRGYGPRRACRYGLNAEDYFERFAKEEILLIVQIETQEALDNLDDILAVDGIDVALTGPNDLSIALGIRQQFDNPKFKNAIQLFLRKCREHNIVPGNAGGGTIKDIKDAIAMGFRFIPSACDTDFLVSAMQEAFEKVKELQL